jgi:hypothetical protein
MTSHVSCNVMIMRFKRSYRDLLRSDAPHRRR